MSYFDFNGKKFRVDAQEFLLDPSDWDEDYARGMAPKLNIAGGLTDQHWKIIYYIRDVFHKIKDYPLVYDVCHNNNIGLADLKKLFPTGYHRGALKLAGIACREGFMQPSGGLDKAEHRQEQVHGRVYRVNSQGYLLNADDWDRAFAIEKAKEMKMAGALGPAHWAIIEYLRARFEQTGIVPTVYRACEDNGIDLDELARLFPDGYHRGAVKLAGLRHRF